MSNVYPIAKGMRLWQYVSIDLIKIKSPKDGAKGYVLSAICNFCKAVELISLKRKTAQEVS